MNINVEKKFISSCMALLMVLNACSQAPSNGKIVPRSSEDAKTYPGAKPTLIGKKYYRPKLMILW